MNMWDTYHNYLKENHMTYQEYVFSPHWKKVRSKFYESRKGRWRCDACYSKKFLHVHHKTYARIGKERLSDLCFLCKYCHKKVHLLYKKQKDKHNLQYVTDVFIGKPRAESVKKKKSLRKYTNETILISDLISV